MRLRLLAILGTGLLAGGALGQEPRTAGSPQEAQPLAVQPGRPGEERGGRMRRMVERLAQQLDLDEDQRRQFDEIVAAYDERMRDLGARWREVRQAMQDGDTARAEQLRAELRGGPADGNPMMRLLDEIEPILREDQLARLDEVRDRMDRGGRDRGRLESLIEELNLDDEQRAAYEEIMRTQREQTRERWAEMRPLMEELREARAAGDDARVEEIEQQLAQRRGDDGMVEAVLAQLEPILREEQRRIVAEFRQDQTLGRERDEPGAGDLRGIFRAARRLELSADQREQLREIERNAGPEARRLRGDREAAALLAARVKKEIVAILDADQAKRFEELLTRDRPRDGRRGPREGQPPDQIRPRNEGGPDLP